MLCDRAVACLLMAGTTAATTPEIAPEISSSVTRIDRSRFLSRQVSWKNLTIGASIYATTKLIKKGNNTPLSRRIRIYNTAKTSTVMILLTTHFRSSIDGAPLFVVSEGILEG